MNQNEGGKKLYGTQMQYEKFYPDLLHHSTIVGEIKKNTRAILLK